MSTPDPRAPRGATSVTGDTKRRKWLLPALLGLLGLIALAFLISRCGSGDNTVATTPGTPSSTMSATNTDTSTPATSPTTMAPSASETSPSIGTSAAAGTAGLVVSEGAVVLGDGQVGDLTARTGQRAVGRAVRVQSVPADEGFWAGTDATNRIWVQLTGGASESDYQVKTGDIVDFTGTITPVARGFAAQVGLSTAEGADQLTTQKQYIAVPKSALKQSR
jgi:hypothetical protein